MDTSQEQPAVVKPAITPTAQLEIVVAGVEPDGAIVIRTAFQPFVVQVAEWQTKVATVTDPKIARASRLLLKKIRVEAEHKKDEIKKGVLTFTRAIDSNFKAIESAVEPMEKQLLEIETAAERAEQDRKKKLSDERAAELEKYGVDSTFFQLAEMPDAQFSRLLDTSRAGFEAKAAAEAKAKEDARIAAEKAEAARVAKEKADADERERVRLENERLKREADARAEADRIERDRIAAEKKAADDLAAAELLRRTQLHAKRVRSLLPFITTVELNTTVALQYADATDEQFAAILAERQAQSEERERLAREKAEADARAKAEREAAIAAATEQKRIADDAARVERERVAAEKAELERKATEERAAREQLEAADRARRDAEARRQQDEADAVARAAAAPDREKLDTFAKVVRTIEVPAMATTAGRHAAANIRDLIDDLVIQIELAATRLGGKRAGHSAELPGMAVTGGAK